jgi:hypothetical protein
MALVNSYGSPQQDASRDFSPGRYDVGSHQYPSDLFNGATLEGSSEILNTYGSNYVIFYINVATDSKLFQQTQTPTVDDIPPRLRGNIVGQEMSKEGLIAAFGSINLFAGGAGGALLGGDVSGAVKGIATAAIPTVGAGIATTRAPDATRSQKRLKTAIAMHIPNQLQIRYGVQYSEEDTAALLMANSVGSDVINAFSENGFTGGISDIAQNNTSLGDAVTALTLGNAPGTAGVSAALGLANNPKKDQVFKGVDFRSFNFEYQFFPRNVNEAENIMNIIREFKYHMHPEFKDANQFLYIYPSEFDIFYYQGAQENLNIHKHTSCVLTEMNLNYTPNGNFTTFDNGMPTQINMTLTFRELALLSKETVKEGL